MNKDQKKKLIKRFKSLAWRVVAMAVLVAIDFLLEEAGALAIPDVITVILGLLAGEITKYLNNSGK